MRRVVSAITTPNWSCREDELKPMAREARRLGIRLHSHLSETHDYVRWAREVHGTTPIQFVAEHEWVGDDVWFAHMVHLDDDEIRLCADTGTGMSKEIQSKIFDPFFTTKETGKGTGLGLAIVQSVVDKHGGRVRAQSKGEGKGTTFFVQLPLQ